MERMRVWRPRPRKRSFHLTIVAIVVIILVVIILAVVLSLKGKQKENYAEKDRVECPGLTEKNCTNLLCEYQKVKYGPTCFMKKDSFGFQVQSVTEEKDGISMLLTNIAETTPYGKSLRNVVFKLTYLTENILRFQFKDADSERYEVPIQAEFPLLKNSSEVDVSKLNYEVTHSNQSSTFQFAVKRKGNDTYLWDTSIGALMLSDQFLQIGSYLPSEYIYGLGEHVHDHLKHDMAFKSWPMFSQDRPPKDHGNLYGVHPFYTCLESSGKSHGVFLLNSNAMEVTFLPAPAVTFRTIGGILDFFIFVGNDPEHVVQLYTSLIGRPMVPPYWSLGFQLSRFGYKRLSELKKAVERTRAAKIPQAVQFLDIDHMNMSVDFTWDKEQFAGLIDYINETKSDSGLKWIIILDPAIAAIDGYEPYDSGVNDSVFVRRSPSWNSSIMFPEDVEDVDALFGRVWPPTHAAFPDFFKDSAKQWWKDNIVKYRDTLPFDGLWIDMNEPANFGTNEDNPSYCPLQEDALPTLPSCWSLKCPHSKLEDPPYNPLLSTGSNRLSFKTICMESIQGNGSEEYTHYNVHSLYGWSQTLPTLEATQQATGTRSLVITRSTYPSSGRYAGHWLGDNQSSYDDMRKSIIGMLEFNLFGIPYVGADVCGFFGDTTEDLCKKWMQLGAFYPFYRNHNGAGQIEQDPAVLGEEVAVASKNAIDRRISLNPYLYTLFYRAHVDGSTVVRPLFHEFPQDAKTWDIDTEFMWGSGLLITPILGKDRKSITKYLPKDEWWFFEKQQSLKEKFSGWYVIEPRANEGTPVHVRGGYILPYGNTQNNVTDKYSTASLSLYIFPKDDKASGELFVDDGMSIDTIENEAYALYTFQYNNCTLVITKEEAKSFDGPHPVLDSLVVFKVKEVADATAGGTNYNATTYPEYNSAEIFLASQLNSFTEITWKASDGSCQMLP